MSQRAVVRPPKQAIPLPEDEDVKLSLYFYSSALVMEDYFTPIVYELGIKNQQINGLTRIPRDMQKGNIDFAAMLRRLIGPITQFNITTTTRPRRDYLLAALIMLGFMSVVGYLYVSPEWRVAMTIWWGQYGAYFAVGILLFLAIALLWVYTRRRSRRNRPV